LCSSAVRTGRRGDRRQSYPYRYPPRRANSLAVRSLSLGRSAGGKRNWTGQERSTR
jgi:hypothetical protein